MSRRMFAVLGVSALTAFAIGACTRHNAAPTSPSATGLVSADEVSDTDGSTLKVSAPTLVSPINEIELTGASTITLICNAAVGTYATGTMAHEFEVYDGNNAYVTGAMINGTTWVVPGLVFERRYTWRVRAHASYVAADGRTVAAFGPWSVFGAFRTPKNEGYLRGNELYDPLTNGRTVGTIVGPAHFVPGVGISLDSLDSYVYYPLQSTLSEGEFSLLATNVRTRTEGGKTKVMSGGQNFDDITTNERRMTFEKRSDGTVAWRLITHGDQIDTEGAERRFVQFNLTDVFFFQMTWRGNYFEPLIKRGGANGQEIYRFGKAWRGRAYDPTPHVLYIGGPGGRAGNDSGTVPNIIIRQVWASPNPRPSLE